MTYLLKIWHCITVFVLNKLHLIKRLFADFLLRYVLGWKIDKNYDDYEVLRKGKHVMTYSHTSEYEIVVGCLFSHAYDIPIIAVAKDELGRIPVVSKIFNMLSDMIFIDRKINTNTTDFISNELNKRRNFVLLISPEGSRKKVEDLKSGFYHIAHKTNSDIYHTAMDFENHTISTTFVANDAVVQTVPYEKIKSLTENEMKKDKPYIPEKCHLVDPTKIGKTSVINTNKSILVYIPPICVIIVAMVVLLRCQYT